jgi:hypothetical protein
VEIKGAGGTGRGKKGFKGTKPQVSFPCSGNTEDRPPGRESADARRLQNFKYVWVDLRTGPVPHCLWFRKLTGLFLGLLNLLDRADPARRFDRIYGGADNGKIHKAAVVQRWLRQHPRFVLLFLPTDCPRAHPIERCFGDRHDKVTRHHRRKRRRDLVADVERHLKQNGPWHDQPSEIYQAAEVTQALKKQADLPSSAVA